MGEDGSAGHGVSDEARAAKDADFTSNALAWLPDVTRFARALARNGDDADDLVQETFLRAYRFWHTFTPGSDGRRWLFTICRNVFLRRRQREDVVTSVGDDTDVETMAAIYLHVAARDAGLEDMFARFDLGPAITRAIDALPEAYGVVERMVDVDGMTYQEAADLLDIPVGTVRSRLFRARRLLQQDLIEHARDAGIRQGNGTDGADRRPEAQPSRERTP